MIKPPGGGRTGRIRASSPPSLNKLAQVTLPCVPGSDDQPEQTSSLPGLSRSGGAAVGAWRPLPPAALPRRPSCPGTSASRLAGAHRTASGAPPPRLLALLGGLLCPLPNYEGDPEPNGFPGEGDRESSGEDRN